MSTTEHLREKFGFLWDRLFAHPFVVGVGDGSLPLDRFRFYVKQDYFFLVQYGRMLALAAAKAPDLEGVNRFAALLGETLNTEMELHRSYCRSLGVPAEELAAVRPAPVTLAYTDYLLRVAYEGTLTDVIANLLPCQWGYYETGLHLARTGDTSEANPYAEWIRMYSTEEFGEFVEWLRELLDSLTDTASRAEMLRLEDHFLTATRYEYLFWEMSYNMQDWPV